MSGLPALLHYSARHARQGSSTPGRQAALELSSCHQHFPGVLLITSGAHKGYGAHAHKLVANSSVQEQIYSTKHCDTSGKSFYLKHFRGVIKNTSHYVSRLSSSLCVSVLRLHSLLPNNLQAIYRLRSLIGFWKELQLSDTQHRRRNTHVCGRSCDLA